MKINIKKILLFLGITFFINAVLGILYIPASGLWDGFGLVFLIVLYMFVPMFVAICIQKFIYKQPVGKTFGVSFQVNTWFFVAWFLPALLACAAMGIGLLFPGVTYTSEMTGYFDSLRQVFTPAQMDQLKEQFSTLTVHPFWFMLANGLIAGTTLNAIAGLGEELGWRGLLLKELSPIGFWKSSLIIGIIWGTWHAPLIIQGYNYPEHPQLGVLMMIGWTILITPLFDYIRIKSHSVIAASIFHGTINATYGLSIIMLSGGNDLTIGLVGMAGLIVLMISDILLFIYDRFITRQPVGIIMRDENF